MNDLDQRVRDTLRARAGDIEPAPALWQEVRRRRDRRRRSRMAAGAGALAVAATIATVAVPAALHRLRPDEPAPFIEEPATTAPNTDPTTGPSPSAPATDAGEPAGAVAGSAVAVVTDGVSLSLLGPDGALAPFLVFGEEDETRVVALAIRPGSTPDDLTLVLLTESQGMYDLRWLRRTREGTDTSVSGPLTFPDPYNVRNRAVGGSVPAPVWSPDGRHLAWLEDGPAGQSPPAAPVLRTIGWSLAGPGTGRTADDNAEWSLDPLADGARLRLQDWLWLAGDGEERAGIVQVTDDLPHLHTLDVARGSDGALSTGEVRTSDAAMVDWAVGARDRPDESAPRYLLEVTGGDPAGTAVRLAVVAGDPEGVELPLPDELQRTRDLTSVWMTAHGDEVLVGADGRAWLLRREGAVRPLDGTVWYADHLR
ncbi:MAG TPA: hypothetical protein VHF25_12725 [Nitriliruptorales bacterium]|nr:hypothetical protein [Nitriliruptorales bacterium]